MFSCNTQSLKNKSCFLKCKQSELNIDIFCITETWLNATILDKTILENFNFFRRDREDSYGGVLIAVSKKLKSIELFSNYESGVESIFIQVQVNTEIITIGCIYVSPPVNKEKLIQIKSLIKQVDKNYQKCKNTFIFGDFNVNLLKHNNVTQILLDNFSKYGFKQIIKQHTYPSNQFKNCNSSLIDHCYVTCKESITKIDIVDNILSTCDHKAIYMQTTFYPKSNVKDKYFYTVDQNSYQIISKSLNNINWHEEFNSRTNINDIYELFYTKVKELIQPFLIRKKELKM